MKIIRRITDSQQVLLKMLLLVSVIATIAVLGFASPARQAVADPDYDYGYDNGYDNGYGDNGYDNGDDDNGYDNGYNNGDNGYDNGDNGNGGGQLHRITFRILQQDRDDGVAFRSDLIVPIGEGDVAWVNYGEIRMDVPHGYVINSAFQLPWSPPFVPGQGGGGTLTHPIINNTEGMTTEVLGWQDAANDDFWLLFDSSANPGITNAIWTVTSLTVNGPMTFYLEPKIRPEPSPTPSPSPSPTPEPQTLSFTKTNEQLYDTPSVVVPFPGTATFVLDRQNGGGWTYVETVTSAANGQVNFTEGLTENATYRLRETAIVPADDWILPTGHWLFSTDEDGEMIGIPASHGSNSTFIYNDGLYVGNWPYIPATPSPSPSPTPSPTPMPPRDSLVFTKTNQQLYANPPVVVPFTGTATFVLERQLGSSWIHVETVTNDADGLVEFTVEPTANATYRLRETAIVPAADWILPTGHWQFTTNAEGYIVSTPASHGGNPTFVYSPPGHEGLHVGNWPYVPVTPTPSPSPTPSPTPNLLSFRKTTNRLYETPRVIEAFPGTATFVLERLSGGNWTYVETVTNAADGWVNFTSDLTASATYRVRETVVPDGWVLPTGHWQFSTNAQGAIIGTPAAHGGNTVFVNNPANGHTGLHVGNMPIVIPSPSPSPSPSPAPDPGRLSFMKTNQRLYEAPRVIEAFPGIATFVLERQSGGNWVFVETTNNTANGRVDFSTDLTANATYRVRETAGPDG